MKNNYFTTVVSGHDFEEAFGHALDRLAAYGLAGYGFRARSLGIGVWEVSGKTLSEYIPQDAEITLH